METGFGGEGGGRGGAGRGSVTAGGGRGGNGGTGKDGREGRGGSGKVGGVTGVEGGTTFGVGGGGVGREHEVGVYAVEFAHATGDPAGGTAGSRIDSFVRALDSKYSSTRPLGTLIS